MNQQLLFATDSSSPDELRDPCIAQEEEAQAWWQHWRACDKDPVCRYMLKMHKEPTRAKHIMSDVCDRFPEAALEKIKAFREEAAVKLSESMDKTSPQSQRQLHVQWLGRQYVMSAWQELCQVEPLAHAHCEACGQQCPCHPVPDELGHRVHVHVAGTPCLSWSSMGARGGWLHEGSTAFLCWLRDVMHAGPDVVIHENTLKFDSDIFRQLCSEKYDVSSLSFSPTHMGLPVARLRQYTLMVRRSSTSLLLPFDMTTFQALVGRACVATGRMYFRAPASLLRVLDPCSAEDGQPQW